MSTQISLEEVKKLIARKINWDFQYYDNLRHGTYDAETPVHQRLDFIYKAFIKYLKAHFPAGPSHGNFKCIQSPYATDIVVATRSQESILHTQAFKELCGNNWLKRKKEILPHSKEFQHKMELMEKHLQHDEIARFCIERQDLSHLLEKQRKQKEINLFLFDVYEQFEIVSYCFEKLYLKSVSFGQFKLPMSLIKRNFDRSDEFQSRFPYINELIGVHDNARLATAKESNVEIDGVKLAAEVKDFVGEEIWKDFLNQEEITIRRFYACFADSLEDLAIAATDKVPKVRNVAELRMKKGL